jgi:FtsK/SpoIIIE family
VTPFRFVLGATTLWFGAQAVKDSAGRVVTLGWPVRMALLLIAGGLVLQAGWWVHHHVAWPFTFPRRVRRAMVQLGLVQRDGTTTRYPRLHRKSRSGGVWYLQFRMPVAASSERVNANRLALMERLDCSLRVWSDRGKLHIRAGRHPLPTVHLLSEAAPRTAMLPLTVHLGIGREGRLDTSIANWPHGRIGGTTGGGKTEVLRSLIMQCARQHSPGELQMVLVDFKAVDMWTFAALPHLRWPVVDEHDQAAAVLSELADEQIRRRDLMKGRAKDIDDWSNRQLGESMPRVLVVIDEFADLYPKDADSGEQRKAREAAWAATSSLTRMGRAFGIHVIIATQRPDHDVLPGQIRANTPVTVALYCANEFNSYILLGQGNAAASRLPCHPDGRPLAGRAIFQRSQSYEVQFQAAYTPADEIEREVAGICARYAQHPAIRPAPQTVIALPHGSREVS